MKIEVNINKKYFFILLGAILLFGGVFLVWAFGTNNPSNFGHSVGEMDWSQMLPRLGVEGSVGIGTNDPTEGGIVNSKFTIRPNTATGLAIMRGDGERAFALNPNADGSWTAYDGVSGWVPGITQTGGRVGIGTNTPSAKLDVANGNIRISNGVIEGPAWVGHKWVADGIEITCSSGGFAPAIYSARINNGRIETRVQVPIIGIDTNWRNQLVTTATNLQGTIVFSAVVDISTDGRLEGVGGSIVVCNANWP